MNDEQKERWLPISKAAAEAGAKERNVFRWVKDEKIATRTEKGVRLAELGAVRAYAATRAAAKDPAVTGSAAINGSGGGRVAGEAAGDLAGRVFALFDEGVAPAEVVRRERLQPQVVLDLHRQYVALRELGGSGKPSLQEEVSTLKQVIADLRMGFDFEWADLKKKVAQTDSKITNMVIPHRSTFTCSRGTTGFFAMQGACLCCGEVLDFAFTEPLKRAR